MPELLGVTAAARELGVAASTVSRQVSQHPELNVAPAHAKRPLINLDQYRQHIAGAVNEVMSTNHAGTLFDSGPSEDTGSGGDKNVVSYAAARSKREAAQAQLAELTLQEKLGELVSRTEMERAFFTCARVVRQKLDMIETWSDGLATLIGCDPKVVRVFLREQIEKLELELSESLKALPGQEDGDDDGEDSPRS